MSDGGITIGPILTTLMTAKKERELWFASYMFSWLMKYFCNELKAEQFNIILPSLSDISIDKAIGIYPDMLIFSTDKQPKDAYKNIQDIYNKFLDILYNIYEEISLHNDANNISNQETIKNIIKNYLQVKWFVCENKLTIEEITAYLDNAEHSTVTSDLVSNLPCDRCRILPSTLKVYDIDNKELFLCPICAIRFSAQYSETVSNETGINKDNHFPTLVEISASEIIEDIKNKNDDQISDYLNTVSEYLSYFAVLSIDVDNASTYLKTIQDFPDTVKKFSTYLENFQKATIELIKNYGGKTIYAGGDDLLALIPIKHKTNTLLDLIADVAVKFNDNVIVMPDKSSDSQLIFSAGISVQYYKHPLNDALLTANNALFMKAKNVNGKNSLCMTIRKHSGATFEFMCKMKDLDAYRSLLSEQSMGLFLQEGIYQKMANLAPQFAEISSSRIDYLIDNYFNESCHKAKKDEFQTLKDLIKTDWDNLTEPNQKINKIMNIVNLFRFAKLLKE